MISPDFETVVRYLGVDRARVGVVTINGKQGIVFEFDPGKKVGWVHEDYSMHFDIGATQLIIHDSSGTGVPTSWQLRKSAPLEAVKPDDALNIKSSRLKGWDISHRIQNSLDEYGVSLTRIGDEPPKFAHYYAQNLGSLIFQHGAGLASGTIAIELPQ